MWTSWRAGVPGMVCGVLAVAALVSVVALPSGARERPSTGDTREDPGDPVSLIVDNGTVEDTLGSGSFIVFNRFSPDEFPVELNEVRVVWAAATGVEIEDSFYVFLYEDPDGDLFNGTTYRETHTGTIFGLDGVIFSDVTFEPVRFEGPGDILVAVRPVSSAAAFWGPADLTLPSNLRSFISGGMGPRRHRFPTRTPRAKLLM